MVVITIFLRNASYSRRRRRSIKFPYLKKQQRDTFSHDNKHGQIISERHVMLLERT